MRQVFKYPLEPTGHSVLNLQHNPVVRHVGLQGEDEWPTLWIEHDNSEWASLYDVQVVGTGMLFDPYQFLENYSAEEREELKYQFAGTAVGPRFVWHVYMRPLVS